MKTVNVLEADFYRIRRVLKETDASGFYSMSDDDLVHLALLTLFERIDADYLKPAYDILERKEAELRKT